MNKDLFTKDSIRRIGWWKAHPEFNECVFVEVHGINGYPKHFQFKFLDDHWIEMYP